MINIWMYKYSFVFVGTEDAKVTYHSLEMDTCVKINLNLPLQCLANV